ncbi:MAG: helix-turn-helix transcriptional regulator [Pseudomonadota bacterium]|nr:helix-turn-helix transcriptional regulator [Pseudomonadota bacterium]MEE3101985.1 helix-turn-helix transcriptional regulator [Pseudomonadota bacterium]
MSSDREEEDALLRVMARNLAAIISERKTSAHRVSIAAGLNKNYVGRLVSGEPGAPVPSIAKAIRIARVLGVTLDELIEDEPISRTPEEIRDLSALLLAMEEPQRQRVAEALRLLASASKS